MLVICLKTKVTFENFENRTGGAVDPEFRALDVLTVLAKDYPLLVAKSLLKMVRVKHQDRFLRMTIDADVKSIVEQLHDHSSAEVRKLITQIADQMLRLGDNSFRIYTKPSKDKK